MTQEFDEVASICAAADAEALPPQPAAPELDATGQPLPAPADFNTEAAAAVDMFAALVVGYCPDAAEIWNDGTKTRVAMALAPVMEKYGVTFGNLPPELLLLVMAGPPLFQSAKLIAVKTAEEREKAELQRVKRMADAKANFAAPRNLEGAAPEQAVHPQMGLYR